MLTQAISHRPLDSGPLEAKTNAKVHDAAATARLKNMATEFEATFLAMLIKEMRQPTLEDEGGEGGLFPGDSGDVQGGLFDLFMSRHLANAGGVGLAAYLEHHVHADQSVKPLASIDAHANSVRAAGRAAPAAPGR